MSKTKIRIRDPESGIRNQGIPVNFIGENQSDRKQTKKARMIYPGFQSMEGILFCLHHFLRINHLSIGHQRIGINSIAEIVGKNIELTIATSVEINNFDEFTI